MMFLAIYRNVIEKNLISQRFTHIIQMKSRKKERKREQNSTD